MAKLAHTMFPKIWGESANVLDVYASFTKGSAEAHQVFERAGFSLGRAFAMLADLLNPECIILGGIGMRIGDAFLPKAKEIFQSEALSQTWQACKIVPPRLGERIGDIAALCAAIDQGT
jgi:glucokinase